MRTSGPISDEPLSEEPYDFSLVLGGPLYQFWRRAHLVGDTLELMGRRVLLLVLLAWVPLLLLSLAEAMPGAEALSCRSSTMWMCTYACCSRCRF
jgi:hypothetical protein